MQTAFVDVQSELGEGEGMAAACCSGARLGRGGAGSGRIKYHGTSTCRAHCASDRLWGSHGMPAANTSCGSRVSRVSWSHSSSGQLCTLDSSRACLCIILTAAGLPAIHTLAATAAGVALALGAAGAAVLVVAGDVGAFLIAGLFACMA